jgi:predicted extracellular nuclease
MILNLKAKARCAVAIFFVIAAVGTFAFAQKDYTIAEIQGDKNMSPHDGESVRVSGIVTAATRTGFFLQTPDDKTDGNAATSEGIFVFTKNAPPADCTPGNSVTITGTVEEYRSRNDTTSLTVTEISHRLGQDTIKVVSKGNTLPKPITLTAADFSQNTIDQLERFEGMRVIVPEMTVVAPTEGRVDIKNASSTSDGVFFGVVKGMARTYREPGLDVREFLSDPNKDKIKKEHGGIQVFDSNPEALRVDTDEQFVPVNVDLSEAAKQPGVKGDVWFAATPLNVPAMTTLSNVAGPLHYASGRYTILADFDKKQVPTQGIKPNPLPAATDRQFSIAGMNLENFFDDQDDPSIKEDVLTTEAFQRRLKKVSMAVRDLMKSPDVIGVEEVENLATLKRLAEKINADSVAAGNPDPKYAAYLIDGNDGRGIDSGFLVKSSRVKVVEVKQFGKDEKFDNPSSNGEAYLNDRPPLMLRASIEDAKSGKPFEFTVVVNHLKSFLGYSDPRQRDGVREKKKLQAEFLAKWVDARQKADPNERIILLGDFNFYQFNDGVMDVIGTIKGKPAGKDAVMITSDDLVARDLHDLVDSIDQKQRYSYVYDGNAQAIDHMLINEPLVKHVAGFGYARVNADFPESYRNDDSRPERFSDHDPAVAYFNLDERQ